MYFWNTSVIVSCVRLMMSIRCPSRLLAGGGSWAAAAQPSFAIFFAESGADLTVAGAL